MDSQAQPLVQVSLLPAGVAEGGAIFLELESDGIYTGQRLRTQRPEVFEAVKDALQAGESPTAIERALKVDHRTVEAVARQCSIPIATAKKRMAERMRLTAERMLDQANDTADAQDAKNFVIAAGIADQHWQLLAGEPTSRHEHSDGISIEDVNGWIHAARGKVGAMGASPETAGQVLELGPSATTDSESDEGACGATVETVADAVCIPETGGNGGADGEQSGGGGAKDANQPGGVAPVVSGAGEFSTNGPKAVESA